MPHKVLLLRLHESVQLFNLPFRTHTLFSHSLGPLFNSVFHYSPAIIKMPEFKSDLASLKRWRQTFSRRERHFYSQLPPAAEKMEMLTIPSQPLARAPSTCE